MVTLLSTSASVSPTLRSQGHVTVSRRGLEHIDILNTDRFPAFILYRQNHQASVAAQHPGLANPDISKIIGEQWQNQPPEEKNRWKSLAEEEKLRHQQQYPTYRYQPKRTGRRNSLTGDTPGSAGEKPKCHKCGGRTILTPFTPSSGAHNGSVPPTPGSAITPVTRTLPVLRDLSLQSPAGRRMGRLYTASGMSPNYYSHPDERDEVGPLSPGNKRRRYNGDHAPSINRAMPPRYGAPPGGVAVGPGTPFPFVQGPPPHPYPPAAVHVRRESLPGLRGVMSPPGPMAPPPRPGMGYQQHRLSQGHVPHDRSLTLPPLQTGGSGASGVAATAGKTAEEQIMNINFRYKIKVLSQVAPPAPKAKDIPRGPLIAVEGDDVEAVKELAGWLTETLSAGSELSVNLLEGPVVDPQSTKEEAFAQYHRLAAEWLSKSKEITESITVKMLEKNADAAMPDAALASATTSPQSNRKIDERYDDSSDDASSRGDKMQEDESANSEKAGDQQSSSQKSEKAEAEKMDIDKRNSTASTTSASATKVSSGSVKPVSIIPNYSLHTSNTYARHIPIGPSDPYSPNDHWQWTATQWRGIIGPDLTIYVRDAVSGESGRPSFEIEPVEGRPDVALFVVRREGDGVEASLLRRVGFEVSEWVRAFGGRE